MELNDQILLECFKKLTKLKILNFNYTILNDSIGLSLAECVS